jgi:hypothetical protein
MWITLPKIQRHVVTLHHRLVMSNQRFLGIFVFETKFIIEPKRSLSDLKIFGLNSNILLLLKKSWNTSKSFGFVPKYWINRNVLLLQKKVGTPQKVLVLFQIFGIYRNILLLQQKS